MMDRRWLIGLLGVLAAIGCVAPLVNRAGKDDSFVQGAVKSPGDKAILDYDGPKVAVTIRYSNTGGDELLNLKAHGEILETERYLASPHSFSLVDAAGETFEPPLTLLKSPFAIGDHYSWAGKLSSGGLDHPCTAEIKTAPESIQFGTEPVNTVKVVATISMSGEGPTPAKRVLTFWISPDHGVLQRSFGMGVSRFPVQ